MEENGIGWEYEVIGGITGWGNNTITKCKNYGKITSILASVESSITGIGGIIGSAYHGEISECYNNGNIHGIATSSGGIIGTVDNVEGQKITIKECYNEGESKAKEVGGILGWGHYIQIQDCYNLGTVQGSHYTGGIIGWTGANGSLSNCYNVGQVTGTPTNYVGGVLGNYDELTITNCYYLNTSSTYGTGDDGEGWATTSENDWDGHIEVKDEGGIKGLAGALGDKWKEDNGTIKINKGYPILKWQIEE